MLKEFQWSRTLLSGAQSTGLAVNAIFAPVFGALVDRYGPRWLITIGAFLVGSSMVLIGHVTQPWQFYVLYGFVLAFGINGMGVVVNNTMVTNWFVRKRGLAIAMLGAGTGLGISVLSPISNALIAGFSWRMAFAILGTMVMVVVIPLALLFAKKRPEELGLKPDGEEVAHEYPKVNGSTDASGTEVFLTVSEGLRSSNFWFIFAAYTMFSISWYLLTAHQVPHAIGLGIDRTVAAHAFALVGGMSIIGMLLFGLISDRIRDRKHVILVGLLVYTLGYGILLFTKTASNLYLSGIITGIGYGGVALMPALCGDHFGRLSMGKLFGFVATGGAVGGAIGPVLGGWVFDVTGSYHLAWEIGIVLCFISGISLLMLGQPLILDRACPRNKDIGKPGEGEPRAL